MTYEEALKTIDDTLHFGIDPSLDDITALMHKLGDPQSQYPCIQIAGTNGKSSTARITAALLNAEGYKVGLYTSPGLVEYPERFEIDGLPISHDCFASIIEEVSDAIKADDTLVITEFELLTAAAFVLFKREAVDYAVLEVGMGGRWDATSVACAQTACITGIALDHTKVLGNTVELIAAEKAAIIKPGTKVVMGPGTADVRQVFLEQCSSCETLPWVVCEADAASFSEVDDAKTCRYQVQAAAPQLLVDVNGCLGRYDGIALDMPAYQAQNLACAIATVEAVLGRALSEDLVKRACGALTIPGRFETLSLDPPLVIDAAHNPQGATVVARAIAERFGDAKPTLLLAVLDDKDANGIIEALQDVVAEIVVTQTKSLRALDTEALANLVEQHTGRIPRSFDSPGRALEILRAAGKSVVATGSITLAGEIKGIFHTAESFA